MSDTQSWRILRTYPRKNGIMDQLLDKTLSPYYIQKEISLSGTVLATLVIMVQKIFE